MEDNKKDEALKTNEELNNENNTEEVKVLEVKEEAKEVETPEEVKEEVKEPETTEEVKEAETQEKVEEAKEEVKEPETAKTEEETTPEPKKEKKNSTKDEVEKKIQKQIEKKQEKQERLGIYRIGAYLKEEHKWENYVFLIVSVIVLVLGMLILNGALVVKDDFPLIGGHSTPFGWTLVGIAALGTLYGLYPFFKPAFPEFKKISWLTIPKFIANIIRVFVFMAIFISLFILYDMFIANIYVLIFR